MRPRRYLHAVLLGVAAFVFACSLAPAPACAYFNEVDDKNSAQQDIGEYGQPIAASDIPDGTYTVPARTTSRMCVLYNTAADAATRSDNKELCTVTVSGGSIVASFYLSPAYTHLYLGTGAQAAQLTDSTGTDDSSYMKGVPNAVNTSSGVSNAYFYTIALPAMNSPVVFASYDGGSAGVEEGKWFDRQVVFMPGDDMQKAIEAAKNPQPKPEPEPDPEPAVEASSEASPKSDGAPSKGSEQPKASSPASEEKREVPSDDGTAEEEPVALAPVYVYVDEPAPEVVSGSVNAANEPEERAADAPVVETPAAAGRRGVLISAVQSHIPAGTPEAMGEAAAVQDGEEGLPASVVLAVVATTALLLGCALRAVLFAVGKARAVGLASDAEDGKI